MHAFKIEPGVVPESLKPELVKPWPLRPFEPPAKAFGPALEVLTQAVVRRLPMGSSAAEMRRFGEQRRSQVTPSETMVYLIAPLAGRLTAVSMSGPLEVAPGAALLLARTEQTDCIWMAETTALVVHLRRARLQALASRAMGAPSRLSSFATLLPMNPEEALLPAVARLLSTFANPAQAPATGAGLEQDLVSALFAALSSTPGAHIAFTPARSVQRAIAHLRAYPVGQTTQEGLAAIAGVTLGTLRRNFKSCLGLPISAVAQQVRLDWVQERLGSQTERRSVSELAQAAGFSSAPALARAYQRRFGEAPTRTRARAFSVRRG